MNAASPEQHMPVFDELRSQLPDQLASYLKAQRWFGGKAREIRSTRIVDVLPLPIDRAELLLLIAEVNYSKGSGDFYVLPICMVESSRTHDETSAHLSLQSHGQPSIVRLEDALDDEHALRALLKTIQDESVRPGWKGQISAHRTKFFDALPLSEDSLEPKLLRAEQSNTSVVYGDRLILKLFRHIEEGTNPDLEVGLFLTEKAHFNNVPAVAGWLEYRNERGTESTLGILQKFVPNKGDAWRFTLQNLAQFWQEAPQTQDTSVASVAKTEADAQKQRNLSLASLHSYVNAAELLAKRTAEMHLALSSNGSEPAFSPEPFTAEFQQSLQTSIRDLTDRNFDLLRAKMQELPENVRPQADAILKRKNELFQKVQRAMSSPLAAMRIRIHGDYHLGQVLYTGTDFMIIDFEGEPARTLAERRAKRSALQDVAGMLRSFHYAAFASWMSPSEDTKLPDWTVKKLTARAQTWTDSICGRFLATYLEESKNAAYLPGDRKQIFALLELHLLEKAIYELGYELNNRPAWVGIPVAGISALLNS